MAGVNRDTAHIKVAGLNQAKIFALRFVPTRSSTSS